MRKNVGSDQERIGKMKKNLLLMTAFLLIMIGPCQAGAAVSVSLRLDRSEATLVDSIQMVVSISGARSSDSSPVVHGLENFASHPGGNVKSLRSLMAR